MNNEEKTPKNSIGEIPDDNVESSVDHPSESVPDEAEKIAEDMIMDTVDDMIADTEDTSSLDEEVDDSESITVNDKDEPAEDVVSVPEASEYKTRKNTKKQFKLSALILGLIMIVLLFCKSIHMYSLLNVGDFEVPLACITVGIIALIYAVIVIFSQKAANITLTVLYVIISVIMSVDLVYYNYMGKLPSVALLKMAWQLTGVTGTIKELTGIEQLLPLLDLPLWLLFPLIKKLTAKYIPKKEIPQKLQIVSSWGALALCVLCVFSYTVFGSFKLQYFSSEVLYYHANDIASTVLPSIGKFVDLSKYADGSSGDSPYYGVAEGRNVFVIQVEALQNFVIGEDYEGEVITPVMNSLIANDSFYFPNYYYQVGGGNTSDAEFTVNNSLYPSEDGSSYEKYLDNDYYGLPWLLKDNGYTKTSVFHAYYENYWSRNKAYPNQGFDDFISIEDMEFHPNEGSVFAIDGKKANTDRRLFEDVLETVVTYEEPFYSFVITLSSHHPFSVALADRYVDADNTAPSLFHLYIQSIAYFDAVLGEFFTGLKEAGLYDNSIFVIYGDHYALSQSDESMCSYIEGMTGESYDIFDRFNVPLIIHIPGMGDAATVETVGGHIDVLPTLLNLMGIENDKAVMFGHNLLTPGYEGIVYELMHVKAGSFITRDVFYTNSAGGINSVVYGRDGSVLENDDKYLEYVNDALAAIEDCHTLLDNNTVLIDQPDE